MPHFSSAESFPHVAPALRGAMDGADIGLLLLGRDQRVLYLNRAFIDLWGIPPALAAGPVDLEALAAHDASIPSGMPPDGPSEQPDAAAGPAGAAIVDLPDGRHVRCGGVALPDGRRLLTYCDVTSGLRRRIDEALHELQAELRYTNETLESQAAYLASLAETAEQSARRAEISRLMLEREVEQRRQLEAQLRKLATTDDLTGALNRAALLVAADRELNKARRFGTPLALLMVDADHFKSINDRFGHAGGDMALRALVAACQKCLRGADLIGRMGGEEFVIVLPGAPPAAAEAAAERLRAAVAALFLPHTEGVITLTVSVGMTMAAKHDTSIEQVIARADAALYEAKERGRNRVIRNAA